MGVRFRTLCPIGSQRSEKLAACGVVIGAKDGPSADATADHYQARHPLALLAARAAEVRMHNPIH